MFLRVISFAAAICIQTTMAFAQSTTYVATYGTGTDCTRSSPCNRYDLAFAKAFPEGSIVCLEPGNYGSIVITRSIVIDCLGQTGTNGGSSAAIDDAGFAALTINIPTTQSSRRVVLRGLTFNNAEVGVYIRAAAVVSIENCRIENSSKQGILDKRTGGQTKLFVKDSTIENGSGPGIVATSQAPGVMVLDNVSVLNNTYGVAAATGNNITLKNSTVSGNTQAGAVADGGAQITVENSTITNNNIGVLVGGTLRLLRNNISFNNQAVSGPAISLGGNVYSGNAAIGATPPYASGASGDVYN
jgi:hypothetical protein